MFSLPDVKLWAKPGNFSDDRAGFGEWPFAFLNYMSMAEKCFSLELEAATTEKDPALFKRMSM